MFDHTLWLLSSVHSLTAAPRCIGGRRRPPAHLVKTLQEGRVTGPLASAPPEVPGLQSALLFAQPILRVLSLGRGVRDTDAPARFWPDLPWSRIGDGNPEEYEKIT